MNYNKLNLPQCFKNLRNYFPPNQQRLYKIYHGDEIWIHCDNFCLPMISNKTYNVTIFEFEFFRWKYWLPFATQHQILHNQFPAHLHQYLNNFSIAHSCIWSSICFILNIRSSPSEALYLSSNSMFSALQFQKDIYNGTVVCCPNFNWVFTTFAPSWRFSRLLLSNISTSFIWFSIDSMKRFRRSICCSIIVIKNWRAWWGLID
jgi:hypothetical protein